MAHVQACAHRHTESDTGAGGRVSQTDARVLAMRKRCPRATFGFAVSRHSAFGVPAHLTLSRDVTHWKTSLTFGYTLDSELSLLDSIWRCSVLEF